MLLISALIFGISCTLALPLPMNTRSASEGTHSAISAIAQGMPSGRVSSFGSLYDAPRSSLFGGIAYSDEEDQSEESDEYWTRIPGRIRGYPDSRFIPPTSALYASEEDEEDAVFDVPVPASVEPEPETHGLGEERIVSEPNERVPDVNTPVRSGASFIEPEVPDPQSELEEDVPVVAPEYFPDSSSTNAATECSSSESSTRNDAPFYIRWLRRVSLCGKSMKTVE